MKRVDPPGLEWGNLRGGSNRPGDLDTPGQGSRHTGGSRFRVVTCTGYVITPGAGIMPHTGKPAGLSATVVDALWNCAEVATFRSNQNIHNRGDFPGRRGDLRGRLGVAGAIAMAERRASELNAWDESERTAGR